MNFVNTKQPFASNTYILNSKGSKFPENNGIVIPWNIYIFTVSLTSTEIPCSSLRVFAHTNYITISNKGPKFPDNNGIGISW